MVAGNEIDWIKVNEIVQSTDIMPTLLERAGVAIPDSVDGRSLVGVMSGEHSLEPMGAFAETGIWMNQGGEERHQKLRLDYPGVMSLVEIDTHIDNEVVLKERWGGLINIAKHRSLRTGDALIVYMPLVDGVQFEQYRIAADGTHSPMAVDPKLKQQLMEWIERDQVDILADYALPVPRGDAP